MFQLELIYIGVDLKYESIHTKKKKYPSVDSILETI